MIGLPHKFDFKDKIVIIGTTAMSLHDTKSVPIQSEVYPGVEIHATFFNNMLDNNFIKQTEKFTNCLIILAVVSVVGFDIMDSGNNSHFMCHCFQQTSKSHTLT